MVKPRVIFLGTPKFAVPALEKLLENSYDVCAVYTQPDRPAGRGQKLHPSPVKLVAAEHGIPVFQPEKIRTEENRPTFEELRPDYIVVVAYGQILPRWLLQSARIAPINIHASLLPHYRGAAPINWAIVNGEKMTGVSIMIMEEKLDSGPILMQQESPITPEMTAGELSESLSEIGGNLLIRALQAWRDEGLDPTPQDEMQVSWAPRISKEMARISWAETAIRIHDRIRGMNPWPVAYCNFRGGKLQLYRSLPDTSVSSEPLNPGSFLGLDGKAAKVQCGAGTALKLLEVQMPAKSRVTGRDFVSGARLRAGDAL